MSTLTFGMINKAAKAIKGHVRRTVCRPSIRLYEETGVNTWLKLENNQYTGAYKERGALNKLLSLTDEESKAGVIAASAGNHAQGLSYHAKRLNIASTIYMPIGTPLIKIARTESHGAEVKILGQNYDESYKLALKEAEETGKTYIHPFNDYQIMAGQGTIGLEIMEQVPDLDYIIVPVGGGGLISGIATAAKTINPDIQIIGVEPAHIDSMYRATHDMPALTHNPGTLADGISVLNVGDKTRELCLSLVDEYVTVTDEEIARTVLWLLESEKIVAEGAGAVTTAAILFKKLNNLINHKVACVISGGNINVNLIASIIEAGLVDGGRRGIFEIELLDKPGTLTQVTSLISEMQANIINISHQRSMGAGNIGKAIVEIIVDTRGIEHYTNILDTFKDHGYKVKTKTNVMI